MPPSDFGVLETSKQ